MILTENTRAICYNMWAVNSFQSLEESIFKYAFICTNSQISATSYIMNGGDIYSQLVKLAKPLNSFRS